MKKIIRKISVVLIIAVCLSICSCSMYTTIPDDSTGSSFGYGQSGGEQENVFVVTLNENNGSQLKEYQVIENELFQEPGSNPVFDNNIFLGWYSDGEEYDFSKPVTQNIEIIALWEKVYDGGLSLSYGESEQIENGYKSSGQRTLLSNVTEDFDEGTIQVTLSSPTASDSGIIVYLNSNSNTTFWEINVSYYFFFINVEGSAYLGKVNNGTWTAERVVPIKDFNQGAEYVLKVVLNGTDLYCYVNGELYIAFSEYNFLTGGGFGLRAGAENVSFTNFSVSGKR